MLLIILLVIPSYKPRYVENTNPKKMKIVDLEENVIKEIEGTDKNIENCIITYYDEQFKTNYIIAGTELCITSYNYEKNIIHKKYKIKNKKYNSENGLTHLMLMIYNNGKKIQLFDSCSDGNLRIWDFHKAKLLHDIIVIEYRFYCPSINYFSFTFNDEENIFVAYGEQQIFLVNLKFGIIIDTINAYRDEVIYVKKIKIEKYDILISLGESIIFWQIYD